MEEWAWRLPLDLAFPPVSWTRAERWAEQQLPKEIQVAGHATSTPPPPRA